MNQIAKQGNRVPQPPSQGEETFAFHCKVNKLSNMAMKAHDVRYVLQPVMALVPLVAKQRDVIPTLSRR
jgi:hypothetical protein